jgi:D-alanyl-lipoteichoic acid acyltransferase DltB (MBOAT superfamily)
MTINSISFLFFFIVVFFLYYFPLKEKTRAQNILLLLASYVFYGIANWKMIPLLALATGIFYGLGILIDRCNKDESRKASLITTLGVCLGIGLLLYFKYLNFFITSFSDLFSAFGLRTNWHTFNIILPVGVSFFTFKLISYVIEIHRRHIKPETDIAAFAVYVAFFPAIMAGPIDRPNTFLPQLKAKRAFKYDLAVDGCRQILWGMFKKMVVADNIALAVDMVWNNSSASFGIILLIAAFLYSVQLYADFSGYSDMAIGVGKLLGFKITRNFNYPFFARNIAQYWRNWHISLTSWLTDYVFMPLNITFRNAGNWGIVFAIIINFVLVGLWHGANWTFAAFGLYHGLLYIPLILTGAYAKRDTFVKGKFGLPALKDFMLMIGVFILVSFGNIIFRAGSIEQLWAYLLRMANISLASKDLVVGWKDIFCIGMSIIILLCVEWVNRSEEYGLKKLPRQKTARRFVYIILTLLIIELGSPQQKFIYFQF